MTELLRRTKTTEPHDSCPRNTVSTKSKLRPFFPQSLLISRMIQSQLNSFKSKTPLATFGSLAEKTRASAICYSVQKILEKDKPLEELKKLMDCLEDVYLLRESKKHLNGTEDDFINSQAANLDKAPELSSLVFHITHAAPEAELMQNPKKNKLGRAICEELH